MVHENTNILTFSDACVFQCVCMLHTITKMCYPEISLALKIEEKIYVSVYTLELPTVKFKKQKEVTLFNPVYPVYLTT